MNATSDYAADQTTRPSVAAGESVGAAHHRHHLHGLRRQPAVRLDAVRQSHRCQVPLGGQSTSRWRSPFSCLIETWLVPVEGYLVDRFGPKWVVIGGGILVGIAWMINSTASSLPFCISPPSIGGVGTGCVYGTCVGNALKWFPGRRGLAAGITASGFGAGAAVTIVPISHMIDLDGYEQAFFVFRLLQGGIVFVLSWLLAGPAAADLLRRADQAKHRPPTATRPPKCCRSPCFYVLYVMFVLIAAGGLIHGGLHGADRQGLQDRQGPGRSIRHHDGRLASTRCRSTASSTASAGHSSAGCRTRSAENTPWRLRS